MNNMELYKAVKHQVNEYAGDCGWSLVELWKIVTGKNGNSYEDIDRTMFWKQIVLEDYRHDVLGYSID